MIRLGPEKVVFIAERSFYLVVIIAEILCKSSQNKTEINT